MRRKEEPLEPSREREQMPAGFDPVAYQQDSKKGAPPKDRRRGDPELSRKGFTPGDQLLSGLDLSALEVDQLLFCRADVKRPAVEKDDSGRIVRVNYPDNTYRTIDYNHNNDPCEFIHFGKDGKEIGRMKLGFGFEPPEKYVVKPDGTIERTIDDVRETITETIYNRQGKEIGHRGITSRYRLFSESFNPDGSHSTKREYPDKSTREVVEVGGRPFRYVYDGPKGKQVWTRDDNSDDWYEASDKERKNPWTGTMGFRPDGRLVEIERNGTISEVALEGTRGSTSVATWEADILRVADDKLKTPEEKAQFRRDVTDLGERVKKNELTAEQARDLYKEAYRLLASDSQVGLEKAHLTCLACQIVHQGAHPEDVDQGRWQNCNVTDSELRLWYRQPELAAKIVANNAITGGHTTPGGDRVDVSKSVKPADATCLKTPPGDNIRSYATQLLNLTAVNLELIAFNKANGTKLEYVQGPATDKDNGARLVDNSTNPPSPVYSLENGKPVLKSTVVRDKDGQVVLGSDLRPMMTTPMELPPLSIQNTVSVLEKLTGKPQYDIAIGHFSQSGQADNWILDKVGLASDVRRDSRIGFFKDEASLRALLKEAQRRGKMPLVLQTHTGSGFLRKQVEAAEGRTLGGDGGNFGGGHVVCIKSYNDSTGRVEVDGTWGRSRDKLGTDAVTLADIVEVSQADARLEAAALRYEAKKKFAYKQWCAKFGKREGIDYPEPEVGTAWLKKFR